jgi:hypothetical protein
MKIVIKIFKKTFTIQNSTHIPNGIVRKVKIKKESTIEQYYR